MEETAEKRHKAPGYNIFKYIDEISKNHDASDIGRVCAYYFLTQDNKLPKTRSAKRAVYKSRVRGLIGEITNEMRYDSSSVLEGLIDANIEYEDNSGLRGSISSKVAKTLKMAKERGVSSSDVYKALTMIVSSASRKHNESKPANMKDSSWYNQKEYTQIVSKIADLNGVLLGIDGPKDACEPKSDGQKQ